MEIYTIATEQVCWNHVSNCNKLYGCIVIITPMKLFFSCSESTPFCPAPSLLFSTTIKPGETF